MRIGRRVHVGSPRPRFKLTDAFLLVLSALVSGIGFAMGWLLQGLLG